MTHPVKCEIMKKLMRAGDGKQCIYLEWPNNNKSNLFNTSLKYNTYDTYNM